MFLRSRSFMLRLILYEHEISCRCSTDIFHWLRLFCGIPQPLRRSPAIPGRKSPPSLMSAIIEPLMIVFVGLMIGVTVVALYLPIFSAGDAIK